jgi:hypothetical protein
MAEKKVEIDEATGQPRPTVVQKAGDKQREKLADELGTPEEYKGNTGPEVAAGVSAQMGAFDEDKERAEEAGVTDVAYVDYEKALENYEARVDVETLAERRARDLGVTFDDGAFVRRNETQGGVVTSKAAAKKKAETPRPSDGPTGEDKKG